MTKKHLLLLTAFLCAQSSFAKDFISKQLSGITKQGLSEKPTSAFASRLIGYHVRTNDGATYVSTDSVALVYSGTRGGDFAHAPLRFDLATGLSYSVATSMWKNGYGITQTFDANSNLLTSLQKDWDPVGGTYVNSIDDLFTYDAFGNMITDVNQQWNTVTSAWDNKTKTSYNYDANHNTISEVKQVWDNVNVVWVNDSRSNYDYLNNDRVQYLYQIWDAGSSSWHDVEREVYTYDANHNRLSTVKQIWGGAWLNQKKTTNTIGPNNEIESQLLQNWNSNTSTWDNAGRNDFTNFIGTSPQLEIDKTWDAGTSAYVNAKRSQYTYNTYGQYLTITQDKWNAGGFWQAVSGDLYITFKYEEYATAVKELSSFNGTAVVYPVPANDQLNIDINWNEAQPFSVNIFDMQGRSVTSWQVAATQSYHKSIAVNELPFGTYFIKIDGAKGHIYKQLIVSPK